MIEQQQASAEVPEVLPPCPFCGAKAVRREYDERFPYELYGLIVDHDADCFLSLSRSYEATFAAWTRRAAHEPEPVDPLREAVRDGLKALRWSSQDYFVDTLTDRLRARGVTVAKGGEDA